MGQALRRSENRSPHRRLLGARRERPPHRSAAEQRDELAAWITRLPRRQAAEEYSGTSTPCFFAVFRLMTISILVGNSIGKSPGFDPFKILSTYAAVRCCAFRLR